VIIVLVRREVGVNGGRKAEAEAEASKINQCHQKWWTIEVRAGDRHWLVA